MRCQAERAISPHLRETYLRIAVDWERMADEVRAKEAALGRFGGMESGHLTSAKSPPGPGDRTR
jgi:hypothetical protein